MPRKGGVPKNLKPFKKGKDARRNLDGRPKKLPSLEKLLPEILGDEDQKDNQMRKIIRGLAQRAPYKGGERAAELLMGYGYGRPKQSMEIEVGNKDDIAKKFPFGK